MSMVGFPLLLIPLAIYNIIVFLMPDVSFTDPLVKLTLMSGAEWTVTLSDVLLTLAILLLLAEVIKGARPGAKYFTDHLLSLIVFGAAAAEFVLWPKFGTSTYFLLTALSLVDFLSGIALHTRRARVAATPDTSGKRARTAAFPRDRDTRSRCPRQAAQGRGATRWWGPCWTTMCRSRRVAKPPRPTARSRRFPPRHDRARRRNCRPRHRLGLGCRQDATQRHRVACGDGQVDEQARSAEPRWRPARGLRRAATGVRRRATPGTRLLTAPQLGSRQHSTGRRRGACGDQHRRRRDACVVTRRQSAAARAAAGYRSHSIGAGAPASAAGWASCSAPQRVMKNVESTMPYAISRARVADRALWERARRARRERPRHRALPSIWKLRDRGCTRSHARAILPV